jgi:hypothetical protein
MAMISSPPVRGGAGLPIVGQRFLTGHIANQRPGKQFNHRRQRRAFMAAKGQHRTLQHALGIGRRFPLLIYAPAWRQRGIGTAMQFNLAACGGRWWPYQKIKGGRCGRGQPKAIGLVPNNGRLPPAGVTQAWLGVQANATRP